MESQNGWTALHYAAHDGSLKMAELLINKGAPVDAMAKVCNPCSQGISGIAAGFMFLCVSFSFSVKQQGVELTYTTELIAVLRKAVCIVIHLRHFHVVALDYMHGYQAMFLL
jgi:hypothetical protein